MGSDPIYKPWKGHLEGVPQPYFRDLRSPWLLTTKPQWDDLAAVTIFLWTSTTSQVSGLDAWAASCTAVIFSKVCMLHGYRMVFSPCPWGGFKGWSPVLNNELTTGEKKQSCQKSGKHHSTSMFAAWGDVVEFCLMSVHGVYCTFIRITKWKSNLHVWNSFSRPSCWIVSS